MELDCITGEITYSEPSAEQLAQQKLDKAEQAKWAKEQTARAALKTATLEKLGLTADEVAALLS
jgi:hypothetical protein